MCPTPKARISESLDGPKKIILVLVSAPNTHYLTCHSGDRYSGCHNQARLTSVKGGLWQRFEEHYTMVSVEGSIVKSFPGTCTSEILPADVYGIFVSVVSFSQIYERTPSRS